MENHLTTAVVRFMVLILACQPVLYALSAMRFKLDPRSNYWSCQNLCSKSCTEFLKYFDVTVISRDHRLTVTLSSNERTCTDTIENKTFEWSCSGLVGVISVWMRVRMSNKLKCAIENELTGRVVFRASSLKFHQQVPKPVWTVPRTVTALKLRTAKLARTENTITSCNIVFRDKTVFFLQFSVRNYRPKPVYNGPFHWAYGMHFNKGHPWGRQKVFLFLRDPFAESMIDSVQFLFRKKKKKNDDNYWSVTKTHCSTRRGTVFRRNSY